MTTRPNRQFRALRLHYSSSRTNAISAYSFNFAGSFPLLYQPRERKVTGFGA